jgi:hypothetical protein
MVVRLRQERGREANGSHASGASFLSGFASRTPSTQSRWRSFVASRRCPFVSFATLSAAMCLRVGAALPRPPLKKRSRERRHTNPKSRERSADAARSLALGHEASPPRRARLPRGLAGHHYQGCVGNTAFVTVVVGREVKVASTGTGTDCPQRPTSRPSWSWSSTWSCSWSST